MGLGRFLRRKPPLSPATGDRMILEQLRRAGADLAKPREVLHYSYFPSRGQAERAAESMRGGGYDVPVEESAAGDGQWLALATAERVVDEATVDQTRSWFEQLAAEHGGEYDGWEAAAS